MAFKMKGSAFKLGNVATKSALKQTFAGTGNHSRYQSDEDYAPKEHLFTQGRGKRTRFQQRKNSTGSNMGEVQWIRDNYGRELSKKDLRKAQIDYYNTYGPQEVEVEPVQEKYMGELKEREPVYPTNPTRRGFAGSYLPTEEVWDPTVNEGKGGYVKGESKPTKTTDQEITDESSKYSF